MSPASVFLQPQNTEIAKNDWLRVGKHLNGLWPKKVPEIIEWTYGSHWYRQHSYMSAPYISIDTEYVPNTKELLLLGIGAPGLPVIQWWPKRLDAACRDTVRYFLKGLIERIPVVFQNCMADIPVIEQALGIKYTDYKRVDDTMFLHSLLWCEMPHNLEFLARMYGDYEKMKHLPMTDPLYNAGDVVETIAVWEKLKREVENDPQTWWIYENSLLPLVPIILEAEHLGIRVNRATVSKAEVRYNAAREEAITVAEAYCGYPINMGSPLQLKEVLQYEFPTKQIRSTDEDSIAKLRTSVLPFDSEEENTVSSMDRRMGEGAHPLLESRVLYARAQQYLSHYVRPMLDSSNGRISASFHPWAQNTGRWSTVNPPLAQLPHSLREGLIPDKGWKWVEFDYSQIELRIIAALANDIPLLTAFEKGWDVHSFNATGFFGFDSEKGRYANGEQRLRELWKAVYGVPIPERDSTILQQCVSQLKARDNSAIQAWTELSSSEVAKWKACIRAPSGDESFPGRGCTPQEWRQARQQTREFGDDDQSRARTIASHTWSLAAWIILGGPPPGWEGSDDIRRLFAKPAIYRLCYGGTPQGAPSIPGAASTGLSSLQLIRASQAWINAHPAIKRFWSNIERTALKQRQLRTFLGRRWNFLGHDLKRIQRQMADFPMQGAVADIMNITLIQIKSALGDRVRMSYTMHDSLKLQVKDSIATLDSDIQTIKSIAEQEWDVSGVKMSFPVEMHIR